MSIAPSPKFPESAGNMYDRKMAGATPGQRGPLRFEEGIATDTDVPAQFTVGAMQGYEPAAGRPNRNKAVHTKTAEETMRERAHVGSAAWVEAPNNLTEFSAGGFADHGDNKFEREFRSGSRQAALNPAVVED
jgi:hypothetical protein